MPKQDAPAPGYTRPFCTACRRTLKHDRAGKPQVLDTVTAKVSGREPTDTASRARAEEFASGGRKASGGVVTMVHDQCGGVVYQTPKAAGVSGW